MTYDTFIQTHPQQEKVISKSPFPYRHFQHETSQVTVVLLVGGLGLSDLIFQHFHKFSQHYSVLTFDFPQGYKNNVELADAIGELLQELNVKGWFIGQSYGGFLAQLLALRCPQQTAGLILSNTGTLSEDLSTTAHESLLAMLKRSEKSKKLLKRIPFVLFKRLMSKQVLKKYGKDFPPEEKKLLENLCDIMKNSLTKPHEIHMLHLLQDLNNHFGWKYEDFFFLEQRVLLLLSDDDKTFHPEVKESLIDLMPSPKIVTDFLGGHLALMVHCEDYVAQIVSFIDSCPPLIEEDVPE